MPFNSFSYFLFLPLVYLLFYAAGDRLRWLVLLLSSYAFYAALKMPYLLVALGFVTVFTYALGILLGRCVAEKTRKLVLWSGIAGSLLLLVALKYLPFLVKNSNALLGTTLSLHKGLVSIGVSYFTFQAISYLTDIYLELEEPETHLGLFALYMAFFPKLLQGPIERAGDLLFQLKRPYQFKYQEMRSGILMIAWGLFQKIVVADRLALYSEQVFTDVYRYQGLPLILATYAYALQIYFDFAGCTDMARGTARVLGINLSLNFNSPYLATSVADFWRRWHMSFSRWILDYIFKPLQMSWRNRGQLGTAAALMVTFLISGLWHGATWGFVIWGLLHGCYLVASNYSRPYRGKVQQWLGVGGSWLRWWQICATFNLVSFAWVFFRTETMADACYVAGHLFSRGEAGASDFLLSQGAFNLLALSGSLAIVALVRLVRDDESFFANTAWYRWPAYLMVIYPILLIPVTDGTFIYFRF